MRAIARRVSMLLTTVLTLAAIAGRSAAAQADGSSGAGGSIRGKVVSSADQHAIPDAHVIVVGTKRTATTNQSGEYVVSDVPAGTYQVRARLIGFSERSDTVTVTAGASATADFSLEAKALLLDVKAVTALGIERSQRETPYAMSGVDSARVTKASPMTVQSALYGEVPGLKIQQNSSGPTGGTNLTIRGIKSITGSNRPLIVVDGIPIRDENSGYSDVGWVYGRDLGTGINDINPTDVASVNVLKGAGAAALYGSQAANGVILITTKRGTKHDGIGMDFSSSSLFDNVAFLPDFQNEYGSGINDLILRNRPNNGEYMIDPATGTPLLANGGGIGAAHSWGPPMRGQMIQWWDGQMRPFTPQPDNYRDLYRAGQTLENSVTFSNVSDRSRYRIGFTRNDWTGTFPGSQQDRNTVSLTGDMQLSDRLRADLAFNYYDKTLTNPPPRVYVAFSFPRSLKTDLLKEDYKTAAGYLATQQVYPLLHSTEADMMRQIFWTGLQDRYESAQDRLVGSLRLNYAVADWLNLRVQGGTDYTDNTIENKQRTTQPASAGPSGGYEVRRRQDRVLYGDVLLSGQRTLTPSLGLNVQIGAATTRNHTGETAAWTNGGLVTENWFSVNNSVSTPGQYAGRGEDRTDGVFGSATLSYRDYLYFTTTGRNDWTSTLPPGSNPYFYPSVRAARVVSDTVALAASSGATNIVVNAGVMTNTGQELQLSGSPIRTSDFEWSTTLNFSRNRNEVRTLAVGLQSLVLQNFEDNLFVEARPGRPYGEIYGYDFRRAPDGQKIVDENGFYAKSDTLSLVGNIMPSWLGGLNSSVRYKGVSLSLLFDVRMGGQFASMFDYYSLATGRAKETLFGRDAAHGGLPYYIDAPGNYV